MPAAVPVGRDRLRVAVVRDGRPIDFLIDARTLARLDERPGTTLTDRLSPRLRVPAGMTLNTLADDTGIALAWPTLPPNRDLPRSDTPNPPCFTW